MIKLDFSRSKLREQSIIEYSDIIIKYDKQLEKDANNNSKMVGWMFLPERYDKNELERILKAKEKIPPLLFKKTYYRVLIKNYIGSEDIYYRGWAEDYPKDPSTLKKIN